MRKFYYSTLKVKGEDGKFEQLSPDAAKAQYDEYLAEDAKRYEYLGNATMARFDNRIEALKRRAESYNTQ